KKTGMEHFKAVTRALPPWWGAREWRHAVGYEPIARAALSSGQVVPDDTEVVAGHMRELRAASTIPHRPNAGRGGLQPVVDANISTRVQRDAGLVEPDVLRVRDAARRNQNVAAFDVLLAGWRPYGHADAVSRASMDVAGFGLR